MQHNQTLYTVKDHEGAHLLLDAREINGEPVAEMQLIGALLPFTVKGTDLEPFQLALELAFQRVGAVGLHHHHRRPEVLDPGEVDGADPADSADRAHVKVSV